MGFRTYEDTKVNWLLARERAVCINLGKQNLSQDRGTTRHNSAHGRYGIVPFLGLFLWAPLLRRLTYKNRVTPVSTLVRGYVYAEVLWWSSYKCHLCTSYELLLLVSGRCQTVGSLMLKRKASHEVKRSLYFVTCWDYVRRAPIPWKTVISGIGKSSSCSQERDRMLPWAVVNTWLYCVTRIKVIMWHNIHS